MYPLFVSSKRLISCHLSRSAFVQHLVLRTVLNKKAPDNMSCGAYVPYGTNVLLTGLLMIWSRHFSLALLRHHPSLVANCATKKPGRATFTPDVLRSLESRRDRCLWQVEASYIVLTATWLSSILGLRVYEPKEPQFFRSG